MPIQPIKIPQNVYIEDRIVGPLTLRQILMVGIGGGVSYALWASISKTYGFVGIPLTILVWIPAAISGLFAFLRINDVSLFRICLLALERLDKPGVRTWMPRQGISINIRTFTTPAKETAQKISPAKQEAKIEELSSVLDASLTTDDAAPDVPEDIEARATPSPPTPVQRDRIKASGSTDDQTFDGLSAPQGAGISIVRDIS